MNGYIRRSWPRVDEVGGVRLYAEWWSRPYEYAWVLQHVRAGERVLDVGSGPIQPFVDELILRGCEVTACDRDPEAVWAIEERWRARGFGAPFHRSVCADGAAIDVDDYSTVFCISVIEHDSEWRKMLRNLARAPRLVLTWDVMPITNPVDVVDFLTSHTALEPLGPLDLQVPEDVVEFAGWLRAFCCMFAQSGAA